MAKLKHCPFCGGQASLVECRSYVAKGWRVICTKCKIATGGVYIDRPLISGTGPIETTRYTSDQAAQIAVDTWNRRVRLREDVTW